MTKRDQMKVLYVLLAVLQVGLTVFGQQLAAGAVPIPDGWQWGIPIATAMIVVLTSYLPRPRDVA